MEINDVGYSRRPVKKPDQPVSVKDWFLTLFVFSIPIVNLILCLYWAFGPPDVNLNRRNFCRAALIWVVVYLVLGSFQIFF